MIKVFKPFQRYVVDFVKIFEIENWENKSLAQISKEANIKYTTLSNVILPFFKRHDLIDVVKANKFYKKHIVIKNEEMLKKLIDVVNYFNKNKE
ncbi:MAG: hypothetical protein QXO40_05120 [Candidatus Aenigmatarchaeota archaeon]